MKTRHRLEVRALCPLDKSVDLYRCDVFPAEGVILLCESVAAAVAAATEKPIHQEEVTQAIADRLGCRVRTKGRHCRGEVATVVECQPR